MIDLHAHSSRSDGSDCPWELVKKAHGAGITVLAITDHDTTAGWAEAAVAAKEFGVELVRGIELSVKNGRSSQHLLAYEPDGEDRDLLEMLAGSIAARDRRIPMMVELIQKAVPELTYEAVLAAAGAEATVGRPHIADAILQTGRYKDRQKVFDTYLVEGCSTYISRWAPSIEDAIAIVKAAGGVTVIAHPWLKGLHSVDEARFRQLKDAGLDGVEVDHQRHHRLARAELGRIAGELELISTGSSDYHGTRKLDHDLGCNSTAPAQYERLMSRRASSDAR